MLHPCRGLLEGLRGYSSGWEQVAAASTASLHGLRLTSLNGPRGASGARAPGAAGLSGEPAGARSSGVLRGMYRFWVGGAPDGAAASVASVRVMSDVRVGHSPHVAGTGGRRMGMARRGRRPRGELSGPVRGADVLGGDAAGPGSMAHGVWILPPKAWGPQLARWSRG